MLKLNIFKRTDAFTMFNNEQVYSDGHYYKQGEMDWFFIIVSRYGSIK